MDKWIDDGCDRRMDRWVGERMAGRTDRQTQTVWVTGGPQEEEEDIFRESQNFKINKILEP